MSAGGSQLESAPRSLLSADLGQVGRRCRAAAVRRQRRLGLELELAAQVRDRFGKVADGDGGDSGEGGLPCGVRGTEETLGTEAPGALGNGENAADAP